MSRALREAEACTSRSGINVPSFLFPSGSHWALPVLLVGKLVCLASQRLGVGICEGNGWEMEAGLAASWVLPFP